MVRKAEEIYREALTLSVEEREELVHLLTMQADSACVNPEVEQAWMDEIERREKATAEGSLKWVSGEEVFRDLRKLVSE